MRGRAGEGGWSGGPESSGTGAGTGGGPSGRKALGAGWGGAEAEEVVKRG